MPIEESQDYLSPVDGATRLTRSTTTAIGASAGRPSAVSQPSAVDGLATHPEVTAALEALAHDLPDLPLADHHDRYVAVLELLHGVLVEARPR